MLAGDENWNGVLVFQVRVRADWTWARRRGGNLGDAISNVTQTIQKLAWSYMTREGCCNRWGAGWVAKLLAVGTMRVARNLPRLVIDLEEMHAGDERRHDEGSPWTR